LDYRSKAKTARAERDFANERRRNAALKKRIQILEVDVVLFNQKIAEVDELLRVLRESDACAN
jgi:hypothetical protein